MVNHEKRYNRYMSLERLSSSTSQRLLGVTRKLSDPEGLRAYSGKSYFVEELHKDRGSLNVLTDKTLTSIYGTEGYVVVEQLNPDTQENTSYYVDVTRDSAVLRDEEVPSLLTERAAYALMLDIGRLTTKLPPDRFKL